MRKKLVKRILSALLVMVLLLSAAPLNGFVGLDLFGTTATAASYNVGDIVEFGSYPQSEVKDSATLAALNGKTLNWISYGYYSGTGSEGSMIQGDWMKYADVTHNGNKYRAVRFTQYRPYYTRTTSANRYQDDNGYSTNTTYWFKYEPLRWRVLDPSTGLVLSETCIDAQAYSNTIYSYNGAYWNDAAHTHYASDYATSSIREWLNDDFYNIAFNSTQKGAIVRTTLDNISPYIGDKYSSSSTTDKVFLLSYYEMENSSYGFSTINSDYDVARRAKSTDYAKAQGCLQSTSSSYHGNAYWFLRSPGGSSYSACYVDYDGELNRNGYVNSNYYVDYTYLGVRPALRLNLNSISNTDLGVGDIVEFGSYPQSEVKDSATLAALNGKTLNWVSYGYYSGNGNYGSMVQGDWMKYADVTHNGNKYRAVRFTQYRPYYTTVSASITYQDDNGYSTNTTYWFKYEPLRWRVLDPSTGLVLSETCIDSQAYSNTIYSYDGYYWNDAAHTHYANDYVTSSMREWLNDDFYNTAFNSAQQGAIVLTTLDNSAYSSSYSQYDSASTTDKVFLMSYEEMRNPAYGFSNSASTYDVARRAKSTDYAKAQGCYQSTSSSYQGNATWFLRSPGGSSDDACRVYNDGELRDGYIVYNTYLGVRPALRLNLTSVIPTSPDGEVEVFSENKYIADIWLSLRGGEDTRESKNINMILNTPNMSSFFYNEMKKQEDFRVADVYWETLKIIFEPDGQAKRVTIENFELYEALILDLIKKSMEDKDSQTGNIILDAVNAVGDFVGEATPYKNVVSALKSGIDGTEIYDELKAVNFDMTSAGYQRIVNEVKASSTLSATTKTTLGEIFKDTDFMGACSMIFEVTSSATGFYQKLTEYMIARDMQKEMVTLLTEMKSKTSNEYFKFALQNVINSYKNTDYAAVICTLGLGADITFSFMSTIFDSVAMSIPFYREMKTVYGLSKMFVNFTMNTEGIMDSFHSCGAMNNFIKANEAAIASLANKYKATGSDTDASAYLYAMRTFEHVYVMDLEVAEKFFKDAEVYGLLNTVKNLKEQAINGVTKLLFGTSNKTDYEMFSDSRKHLIQLTDSLFHDLENSWIFDERYLQTDYPEIYPIYVKKELSQEIYTPKMHSYITKEGKTRIDWSIPTYVLTDIGSSKILYGSNVLEGIVYTEKVGSRNQSYEKAVGTVAAYDDNALVFDNATDFATFKKYYTLKAYANTTNGRVYTPTASAELANPIAKPVLSMNKLVDPLSRPGDRINKISFEIEDISLQLYSNIKYTVERKEAGSSSWSLLKTVTRSPNPFRTTTTVFTDSTAQIGKTYDYRVKSSYTFGNGKTLTSPFSEVLTARIGDQTNLLKTHVRPYEGFRPQPMAMKSMAITTGAAPAQPYIEVSWDSTSGATGYEIYRIASYANSFVLIATVGGSTSSYNDYIVDSGVTYDYYVVPIKTTSGKNAYELGTYSHAEGAITADPVEITITYNANGGTVERSSDTISAGESITLPIPSRSGYTFSGWFTSSTGGTAVSSPYIPTDSATLYAHWVEQEESPDSIFEYEIKNGEVIITDCDRDASGEIRVPSFIEGCPVTEIDVQAFVFCDEITSLILPDSIRLIDTQAFNNEKLESITFSNSVQIINADTFGCDSLTDIYFYGTRTDWEAIAISNRSDFEKLNVHFLLEDTSDENASITLDKTTVSMRYKDTPVQLHATLENVDSSQVVWASSKPSVAKVVDGKITSVGSGTATIMAYVKGTNIKATCTVTVNYAWWQWLIKIVLFGWLWY